MFFKAEVKPTPTAAVMEIKQEGPIIVKASKDKKKINQKVSIKNLNNFFIFYYYNGFDLKCVHVLISSNKSFPGQSVADVCRCPTIE